MKLNTFLVKTDGGHEAVMRLPIRKYGAITTKAFKMVRERFNESGKYFLNLEAFNSGEALTDAISRYQKNIL